jgi:hypothetical protein
MLFEIERERRRRELDQAIMSADDRQRVEEAFARWVAAREHQLAEELKPAWQKMVEGFADATRTMREGFDRAMSRMLSAGENAFVQFVRTGKLSARSIADAFIEELARVYWQRNLAAPFAQAAESVLSGAFGWLFGAGSAAGSAAGALAPGAADVLGTTIVGLAHSGGIAGELAASRRVADALFVGAPRLHSGGILDLGPREVPVILEAGEEVITRRDPRHTWNSGANAPSLIRVEIHNEGRPQEVVSGEARVDAADMVVRIVTRDLHRNGDIAQAMQRLYRINRTAGA